MTTKVNAIGDACPIPVVKTKNAIKELNGAGTVETLVDNEIAVQNLTKMANHKGYGVKSEKLSDDQYQVTITVSGTENSAPQDGNTASQGNAPAGSASPEEDTPACLVSPGSGKKNIVVAVTAPVMGNGNDELGAVLIKGFLYALTQQDELPSTILFYNGGATLTCEGSASIEDLKSLEALGIEILTCGTCLNYYKLSEKLKVGGVTNMYEIAERLTKADLVIRP